MKFNINKIVYNTTDNFVRNEEITVELAAKFAVGKESNYNRAFFIELNITGIDTESGKDTRNLTIVARFQYVLDEGEFPLIGKEESEEDSEYFYKCLLRLNDTVKNVTSHDDSRKSLDIDKAVETYKNGTTQ